jgi:rubredoxin-NAD+ reductase
MATYRAALLSIKESAIVVHVSFGCSHRIANAGRPAASIDTGILISGKNMKPIVIIGTGLAGYTVAREFRKLDKDTPLQILTADSGGYYSKPMLSNAYAQNKQALQLVTHSSEQMAEQLNAQLMSGVQVEAIDTANKRIKTSAGDFDYDKLVLAVGAQPIRLGLKGNAAHEVLAVNNVDDYAAFRKHIDERKNARPVRIAILGAGLIGCEFADDLSGAGHQVTLIDPSARPLAALAAPALSEGLQQALSTRGVQFHLNTVAESVDRVDTDLRVQLADGNTVEADVVLSAVGLRPDLRLAQSANLKTNRGILIDIYGQTSAPDVYALGDCAEYTMPTDGSTRTLPYIAPIMPAGRAIARTLTGEKTAIDLKESPVLIKTPSYPLALIAPPPHAVGNGSWQTEERDAKRICRFFDADGVMIGFGVSPHDNAVRQELMGALGKTAE